MQLHTKKQQLYYEEVIRLHYEKGYVAYHISRILPIGHSTVSRWIAILASENDEKSDPMKKKKSAPPSQPSPVSHEAIEFKALQEEVARFNARLKDEKLRADAYDEMINVAESKFKLAIRKKVGVKR
jgi:hypothetical protein